MLQKVLIAAMFIAVPLLCHAQKHDFNWLFGYYNNVHPLLGGANIDFNASPPFIYTETKKIDFAFYCGICSDSSGHLAFYTNGISIRDVTHERMLNGDTINPGPIWLDWQTRDYPNGPFCFALSGPGKHDQYYFFHMGTAITPITVITSPFYYTIVDMNGNNGLGQVTQKNQIILPADHDYIDPVAVKHGNGRDWWIIAGELSTPYLYTFLLDSEGVHGPFTTEMAYQFPGAEYQSVNAISPDGHTYVRADGNHGLYIYDFDRCSGTFSNLRALPFGISDFFGFATVFAPNSKHLYLSSWQVVTMLDLSAANIGNTLDTLAYFDGKASPQEPFVTGFFFPNLAPDGKIYYATTNSTLSMHLIHNPDLPGQAADVEQHGLTLPKYNSGTMCLFPNYRLGEWEGSPCDTLNGQRPGDGFTKSDWYPPALNKPEGYTLLPPLFKNAQPGSQPRARDLNMAELAFKRREENKKNAESDKKKDKN